MKNIEDLLNEILTIEEESKLQKIYKDIFVSECSEYGSIEEVAEAIDGGDFCCENGCIGELIYYYQTEAIFKNHFNEVLELVQKYFEIYGYYNIGLDSNNLIWLTFEFMVMGWYYDIKDYIYNIEE